MKPIQCLPALIALLAAIPAFAGDEATAASAEHQLGEVTIKNTTYSVNLVQAPSNGKSVAASIDIDAGQPPLTLRLWVGTNPPVVPVKNTIIVDGATELDTELVVPETVHEGDAIWLLAVDSSGKRTADSYPLPETIEVTKLDACPCGGH